MPCCLLAGARTDPPVEGPHRSIERRQRQSCLRMSPRYSAGGATRFTGTAPGKPPTTPAPHAVNAPADRRNMPVGRMRRQVTFGRATAIHARRGAQPIATGLSASSRAPRQHASSGGLPRASQAKHIQKSGLSPDRHDSSPGSSKSGRATSNFPQAKLGQASGTTDSRAQLVALCG